MGNSVTIPVPSSSESMLVWARNNGRPAIELLNTLSMMEVNLVPFSSSRGRFSISVAAQNAVIPIPLQYTSTISDPSATTASNTAAIISILQMLRALSILPGT